MDSLHDTEIYWAYLPKPWPIDPNAPKIDYIEQAMIRICEKYNVDPHAPIPWYSTETARTLLPGLVEDYKKAESEEFFKSFKK